MNDKDWRRYFYFSKSDRRAIVALGCIALFAIGILIVSESLRNIQYQETLELQSTARELLKNKRKKATKPFDTSPTTLSPFDPNTVDSITLTRFGLASWKIRQFLRYRSAGKIFRSLNDIRHTHGWTDEDIELITPYVHISPHVANTKKNTHESTRDIRQQKDNEIDRSPQYEKVDKYPTLTTVNLNEADSATLRRIPGIGRVICNIILKYRSQLGGFHSVSQLRDIQYVSPELLEWFTLPSEPQVRKIHLNTASFQALNSHPYISYEQTKALLDYIRLYGHIKDEQALSATGIFSPEELTRLLPYLSFQ